MRGIAATFAAALALAAAGAAATPAPAAVPHYKHVFIVVLENENSDATFGPQSKLTYLSQNMRSRGAYLSDYYAIGHLSLGNYIAMVSGQAPNPQTQGDCNFFNEFGPATPAADGQVIGTGCVYPASVKTIADQLEAKGRTWKGYMQGMAAKSPAEPATCRHPAINSVDDTQSAEANDRYATRHNPFVYFRSIIDRPTCAKNDVDLSLLTKDLKNKATTPSYAFISPDLCNDGHDEPCVNGDPGGPVQANKFLQEWVPKITRSAGYKDGGLLVVTFDEAEVSDATACCGEKPGPNTPSPGGFGPGGGKIGAVMLSPCIRPGTVSTVPYNHYSLLRSIEDNFGLAYLGFAGQEGLTSFGTDILNRSCASKCKKRKKAGKRKGTHGKRADAAKKKAKKCRKRKRPKHKKG